MARTPQDRADDRAAAAILVQELRSLLAEARSGLQALPSPSGRTAAQRAEAFRLRGLATLAKGQLLSLGVAGARDRDPTPN